MPRTLVIFYSRRGQNYVDGAIVDLPRGNTETVAGYIAEAVGADLFQVETVRPYSPDYTTCTREAKEELRSHARPKLRDCLTDISGYHNTLWWPVPAGGAHIPAASSPSWSSLTSRER